MSIKRDIPEQAYNAARLTGKIKIESPTTKKDFVSRKPRFVNGEVFVTYNGRKSLVIDYTNIGHSFGFDLMVFKIDYPYQKTHSAFH